MASEQLVLDREIRCGLTLSGLGRAAARDDARRAEALGYDSLWVTDHLAFHTPVADALTLLAFVAAVTERIALGTAIYILPLRPSLVVAKQAAAVDLLSNGRLTLGVGIGGEYPPEFEAAGVPVAERGRRADQAIALLRRFWSGEEVTHHGRFERFGPLRLQPGPARPGGPPLWVGGRSERAMARAGRLGDGYISHFATPEHYAANLGLIAEAAKAANRPRGPFGTAAFLFTCLGDTVDAAAQRASAELERIYAQSLGSVVRKYCLLGPPEEIAGRMRDYAQAGVRHFVLAPLVDASEVMERVAAEVLPELPAFESGR